MAQNGQCSKIGLKATDKLEFTAWFEVNRTFGSGDITILILDGPIAPPPHRLSVKVDLRLC